MRELDREQMRTLAAYEGDPCVTILLPVPALGAVDRQSPVRLANLIREARGELQRRGDAAETIERLLAPAQTWADGAASWAGRGGGLALFLSAAASHGFRVPIDLPASVTIGPRFLLRPLLPLIAAPARFHLLALSLGETRLLDVGPDSVSRVALAGLPNGFEAAMGELQYETGVYARTASAKALGARAGIVYGHGDGDEEHQKDDVLNYLRRVMSALERGLGTDSRPLVVAAVGEHLALLRRVKSAIEPIEPGLTTNPDHVADHVLAASARRLLAEASAAEVEGELARWRELRAGTRAVEELAEVVRAADEGRVATLFVAANGAAWGSFEPELARVEIHNQPAPGDVDLLDLAAVRTLAQRGEVFVLPPDRLPDGRLAVARLRYSVAA